MIEVKEIISSEHIQVDVKKKHGRKWKFDADQRERAWVVRVSGRLLDDSPEFLPARSGSGVMVKQYSATEIGELVAKYDGAVAALEQGEEGGEDGYLHWHIYIEHKNPIRAGTLVKKFKQGEIQPRWGTRHQIVDYVTKMETKIAGPFWFGDIRLEDFQGRRVDMESFHHAIVNEGMSVNQLILADYRAARHVNQLRALEAAVRWERLCDVEREVVVEYHWGDTGTGKTRGAFEENGGYRNVYKATTFGKNEFDNYGYEPVLLLDEYRGGYAIGEFLSLIDRYPYQLACRYANKLAGWTKVIITSNEPLEHLYTKVDKDAPGGRRSLISAKTRAALERRISRVVHYTEHGVTEELRGVRA